MSLLYWGKDRAEYYKAILSYFIEHRAEAIAKVEDFYQRMPDFMPWPNFIGIGLHYGSIFCIVEYDVQSGKFTFIQVYGRQEIEYCIPIPEEHS